MVSKSSKDQVVPLPNGLNGLYVIRAYENQWFPLKKGPRGGYISRGRLTSHEKRPCKIHPKETIN